MVETFVAVLMSAEVEAVRNAPYGAVSEERVNTRKGIGIGTSTPGRAQVGAARTPPVPHLKQPCPNSFHPGSLSSSHADHNSTTSETPGRPGTCSPARRVPHARR